MSKLIGIFEPKPCLHTERVSILIARHLRSYFGSVALLEHSDRYDMTCPNASGMDILTSSFLPSRPSLFASSFDAEKRRLPVRRAERDFNIYDVAYDEKFLNAARAGGLVDVALIVQVGFSSRSQSVQFAQSVFDTLPNCRVSVIFRAHLCPAEADELFNQFEILVDVPLSSKLTFAACLPYCENRNRYRILETMSLQAISLSLLNLNSELFANNIPFEIFEGYLH